MSLHPQHPIPPVPKQTARIAQTAFPKGNPYLTLRDRLGTVFVDKTSPISIPSRVSRAIHPGDWRSSP